MKIAVGAQSGNTVLTAVVDHDRFAADGAIQGILLIGIAQLIEKTNNIGMMFQIHGLHLLFEK